MFKIITYHVPEEVIIYKIDEICTKKKKNFFLFYDIVDINKRFLIARSVISYLTIKKIKIFFKYFFFLYFNTQCYNRNHSCRLLFGEIVSSTSLVLEPEYCL